MSYRKLNVNGVKYEYVIGRKNTKVKKDGKAYTIFDNSVIGSPIISNNAFQLKQDVISAIGYQVTPLNVHLAIEGKPIPTFHCRSHDYSTQTVTSNPYTSEIEGINLYMIACPTCVENCAGDI